MAKANWLTISPMSGIGNATIRNIGSEHTGRLDRTTTVTGKAVGIASEKTYSVVQHAKSEFVTVNDALYQVAGKGGAVTVTGTSNSPILAVTVDDGGTVGTLTVKDATVTNGQAIAGDPGAAEQYSWKVEIQVAENPTANQRSLTVRVQGSSSSIADAIEVLQAASSFTYEYVPSASVSTIAAYGGNSVISAQLKTYRNGSLVSTQTVTPTLTGSATGFSISGNTVTAENRGTTVGDAMSIVVTCTYVTTETGETLSDTVTISQAANNRVIVYGKPTITSFEVADIPASGGSVSSGDVEYSQSRHYYYDSGQTEQLSPLITGGQVTFGDAVSAGSLGTTVKSRTIVGQLTCHVAMNGQISVEVDASVYQQANVRTDEGISYGSWDVSISASDFTTTSSEAAAGGGSCTITASATRTRTQNYSYTSGATSTASMTDETATPTLAANGMGLTAYGTDSIAVWEDRGTEIGDRRSGIVTATYGEASASVTLYQAANSVDSYSFSNFDVRVNNWDCPASGGTCPLTSSIYRAPIYTSGAKGSSTKIDVTSSTSWEVTSGEYFGYISGDNLIVSSRGTDWDTSSHNIYVEGSYSGYTDSDYARVAANNRTKETSSVSVSISADETLLPASGGNCTLSYSASYQSRYAYDSGSYSDWETSYLTPTISGSGTGFSRSGSTVTAADRGTTTGGERSVTYTASYEGTSDQVTIYQEANEITETTYSYSNISATADDIPASGGSISSGTLTSVRCVPHYRYTSGSESDGNAITSLDAFDIEWGTAVSASSRGTTVGDRKSVGTLTFTVSYKWGTGSGSGSVTIYQEENVANPIDEYGDITNITLTGVLNFPGKGASYQGDIMAEETIYHRIEYTSGDIVLSDTETVELDRMNANGDISSSDSWIEVVMTNTATYMITVSANPNSSSRSGTVTVTIESDESGNSASKDFTVTQKGGGVDNYLNVSPTSLSFPVSGGTKSISIDTNESWTIS